MPVLLQRAAQDGKCIAVRWPERYCLSKLRLRRVQLSHLHIKNAERIRWIFQCGIQLLGACKLSGSFVEPVLEFVSQPQIVMKLRIVRVKLQCGFEICNRLIEGGELDVRNAFVLQDRWA